MIVIALKCKLKLISIEDVVDAFILAIKINLFNYIWCGLKLNNNQYRNEIIFRVFFLRNAKINYSMHVNGNHC